MKIRQFIEDTKHEIKKVNWPTKHKVTQSSIIVVIVVVVLTLITALLDVSFGNFVDIISARF